MNICCALFFLIFLHFFVEGVEYGPSLSSLTGVFVNWKGPDIFAIQSGQRIVLERYPGFSATLPLISGNSTGTSDQIFKERGISTVGEFVVEAPKGFGIIMVIQELKLRKNSKDRSSPGLNASCSDYLQIGELRSEGSGSSSVPEKICGLIARDDLSLKPKGLLGPRTYRSSSPFVRVAFNHAYVNELVESLLGSKQKHLLKAELTFTAYKSDCNTYTDTYSHNTTPTPSDANEETFEICSDYKFSVACISSKLVCNEILNCGGDNETLGSDDNAVKCPDKPQRTTESVTQEDQEEKADAKQDSLANLAAYLGIPSLSQYTTKKYERNFRPAFVPGSVGLSGSGFIYDASRRSTDKPSVMASSTTTESSHGGSIQISHIVGPTTRQVSNSNTVLPSSNDSSEAEFESEIYSRRELSHAINSVIYGVAVFIMFTIFVTVLVVCLTKRIQVAWSTRSDERRESAHVNLEENRQRRVSTLSTPGIPTSMSTLVVTSVPSRRSSQCDAEAVDPIPVTADTETYDLPPAYDTLFP